MCGLASWTPGEKNPYFGTIRLLFQISQQLCCPPLDKLQPLNVVLVVRGSKLDTGFEVWPHECTRAGHILSDSIGILGHLATLARCQPSPPGPFPPPALFHSAFQPLCPKSAAPLRPKRRTRMFRPGPKGDERKRHGLWGRNQRATHWGGRRGDRRPPKGRRNPEDGAGRQPAPFRPGLPPSRRYPGNGAAGATRSPGPAARWWGAAGRWGMVDGEGSQDGEGQWGGEGW